MTTNKLWVADIYWHTENAWVSKIARTKDEAELIVDCMLERYPADENTEVVVREAYC